MSSSLHLQRLFMRNARSAGRWTSQLRATSALQHTRGFVSATLPLLEKKSVKVPSMGDSITEGTIVEWAVQVGEAVKDGDVVAMVETDKVTIDIKAEMDGVITQQFGAVDDTIEVGGDLYEIDTEAVASEEGATAAAPKAEEAPTETKESASEQPKAVEATVEKAPASASSSHRSPSIHFLGKEGWAQALSGKEANTSSTTSTSPAVSTSSPATSSSPARQTTVLDGTMIHPMYGRPKFTEAEMEALITGGANMAPEVVIHSSGAKFSY